MLNNALYKSGLFLSGASVGEKRHTFELDKLGGLAGMMPVSFLCAVIFACAISGVPPFNGFASKWMLYQGILIGLGNASGRLMSMAYVFALLAAMFGSILTLASFLKFIHSVFLGQDHSPHQEPVSEVSPAMRLAVVVIAGLCVLLGIFPQRFLAIFIQPYLGQELVFIGTWKSMVAFCWLAAGLVLGVMVWGKKSARGFKRDSAYIGGETTAFAPTFPGTEFYRNVAEMPVLGRLYQFLQRQGLDLYRIVPSLFNVVAYVLFIFVDRLIYALTNAVGYAVLGGSWLLRRVHNGILDWYLLWSIAGLLALFFILLR